MFATNTLNNKINVYLRKKIIEKNEIILWYITKGMFVTNMLLSAQSR